MKLNTSRRKIQRSGQDEKNVHEGKESCQRLQDTDAELERIFHEHTHVLADTLIRVICAGTKHGHTIISFIFQPFINIAIGQPAPPVNNKYLLQIKGIYGQDNIQKCQPGKMNQLVDDNFFIIILQSVIECIIPLVQKHQHVHHAQGQSHDDAQEEICLALFL